MFFADPLSTYSTPIFDLAATGKNPPFIDSWMAILAFSLQLYFDFSGYCDMAIGISYFFNIKLPFNFNSPYKAVNIIDFWRRWHMTLSAFLRDYLYIPLGGNRHGTVRRWFNVFVTMLIGGLWHGAGWTFVIWGGLHGFYLIVNHCFQSLRAQVGWPDGFFGWLGKTGSLILTFFSVIIAWVFFRSPDVKTAANMFSGMFDIHQSIMFHDMHLGNYFVIYLGLVVIWFFPNTQQWLGMQEMNIPSDTEKSKLISRLEWNPRLWWNWAIPGIMLALCILQLTNGKASEFLYFQF
jgi:D-alanyl-lipoteichoic acid acyltransferase DltB (MBOAT superfamily)